MTTLNLSGYTATISSGNILTLGTWDSYGIEQLQISPGPEWAGLVITATFVTPSSSTRIVVPESGIIDVPPEATAQQLPVPTPGGLPGIPVNSGGNWVDENGQAWVSDVIDLAVGTKTQYCGQISSYNGEEITTLYISSTGALTTGAQIVYVLPEPVTAPLDAEIIAAYKTLQSYPGTTNIMAPDCGIEVGAVADGTAILADINSKLAALQSAAAGTQNESEV